METIQSTKTSQRCEGLYGIYIKAKKIEHIYKKMLYIMSHFVKEIYEQHNPAFDGDLQGDFFPLFKIFTAREISYIKLVEHLYSHTHQKIVYILSLIRIFNRKKK